MYNRLMFQTYYVHNTNSIMSKYGEAKRNLAKNVLTID